MLVILIPLITINFGDEDEDKELVSLFQDTRRNSIVLEV